MKLRIALSSALAIVLAALVSAADVSGKWTATFDTQVGQQSYTWDFVVKGTTLTGTIKGNLLGESKVTDGKVDGDKITFVENGSFMEVPLRIEYSGTMTSADEIKFTRTIMDFKEEFVAKRVK
jgi:opacity protein-like surface antigen